MRVRVDLKTDPISLKVVSHSGIESNYLADEKIIDVTIDEAIEAPADTTERDGKNGK